MMDQLDFEVPNASRWEAVLRTALILAVLLVAAGCGWLLLRLLP